MDLWLNALMVYIKIFLLKYGQNFCPFSRSIYLFAKSSFLSSNKATEGKASFYINRENAAI